MIRFSLLFITALFCLISSLFGQETLEVHANRDNTLIETQPGDNTHFAHGSSHFFFVGRTNQSTSHLRRGLLHFDVSSIPTGATIESVTMSLHISNASDRLVSETINLHRLTKDWGESTTFHDGGQGDTAHEGDATWVHTFFDTALWQNPGGDFVITSSDSFVASDTGFYTVPNSTALIADVQGWVNDESTNFGWIFIGNETLPRTVKQFDSGENPTDIHGPILTITYSMPTSLTNNSLQSSFTVFPNPVQAKLMIKSNVANIKINNWEIVEVTGKRILSLENSSINQVSEIRIQELSSGIYILKLATNKGVITKKFIKE